MCGIVEQIVKEETEQVTKQGIARMVAALKNLKISDELIAEQLMEQYRLDEAEAMEYIGKNSHHP